MMKKNSIPTWLIIIANIVLITVFLFLYITSDKEKPLIDFSNNDVTYMPGMEEEFLMQGVTAADDRDGDITDRIVIEKITENKQQSKAVVFYAVSDTKGNVARASREFEARYDDISIDESETTLEENNVTDNTDSEEEEPDTASGETAKEEDKVTEEEASKEAEEEASKAEEEASKEAEEEASKAAEEASKEAEEAEKEEAAQATKTNRKAGAPILQLKTAAITVEVGQGPAWVTVIGNMSDDKDSYETLFNNLIVSKWDRNKPGIYRVSVQTKDSDDNLSNACPLIITVK